jgi:tight adherence protein B
MTPVFGALAAAGVGLVFWWLFGSRRPVPVEGDPAPGSDASSDSLELAVVEGAAGLPARAATGAQRRGLDYREVASAVAEKVTAPAMSTNRRDAIQVRLSAAGTGMKPHEFLGLQLVCGLVAGLLAYARFGSLLALLPLAVVGYFLPRLWLRRLEKKRRVAIERQLADVITLLANALKAGHSTQQAIATVAEAGREPMGTELQRVVREMSLGLELEVALQHINARLQSKDFDMLVTAVIIHRRVGGNLAEVLGKISHTVRERVKIHGEVRVLTAQARASGYIVTGLPFAVGGLLTVISPDFERPLFETPLGWGMLAVGLIMVGVGYAIIRKISDIHL